MCASGDQGGIPQCLHDSSALMDGSGQELNKLPVLTLLLGAALLAACDARRDEQAFTHRPPADPTEQPEAESGWAEKPGWATKTFAVAAANPLATDAGYQVLRAGGSAIDAAIAVQMVLTLVEPQSSGIGGGTFVLHWNGDAVEAFDGRETAPAAVDERLFLKADGQPMNFFEGAVGGRSVGTPGTLRVLELAHQRYGRLPWRTSVPARNPSCRRRLQSQPAPSCPAHGRGTFKNGRCRARLFLHKRGNGTQRRHSAA